jgi:HlyD family secretion protein/epimerase transport system membrane fusion protein
MSTLDSIKAQGTELARTASDGLRTAWLHLDGSARALWGGAPSARDVAVLGGTAILAVGLATLLLVIARGRARREIGVPLGGLTRGARRLGLTAALIFFGVFAAWSWYAPLSSAAVAPGVVSPDGSRKTIQHLEGGIIRRIHVREGDRVESGSVLVTMEDVRALARLQELKERKTFLLAVESRLVAEQVGAADLAFPPDLSEAGTQEAAAAMTGQIALFESRKETQAARERILQKRIDQLNEEIAGLEEVTEAQDQQISLIEREIGINQDLVDKGLGRMPPLLALQRELAGLQAERAANRAGIARLGQQIGETELQIHAMRQQTLEEISEQLTGVRAELGAVRSQIPEREDALFRTSVLAPISGRVMNVQVTTEGGGILPPGGSVLDIVPEDGKLVIDARVRPQDIVGVVPGMRARVLLTAYNQRNLPQMFGEVASVSADRLIDERTGEPYFLAKVHVSSDEIEALDADVTLAPGMPADVMILNGERTVLDYLIKPFSDSIRMSFREI